MVRPGGALVRDMAPVVEQVGIDEGYLVLPDGDPREQAELPAVRGAGCGSRAPARRRDLQGRRQGRGSIASHPRRGGGVPHITPVRTRSPVGPKAEVRLVAAASPPSAPLPSWRTRGSRGGFLQGRIGVDLPAARAWDGR